ncbi:MAG: methyltransferase domain-containing protein [Candidatus Omnitrophota bacterium]|nr:methyltransferase domain-containing protein [Candidatus Omnitrophota bacterium]
MIEKNISRHAHIYDTCANIQYAAARNLIKETPCNEIIDILEIGCGTGSYTLFLRKKFCRANIKALDRSKSMIEVAKKKLKDERVEFIVADAESINLSTKFDLITSNAAFQWFKDFEGAILKYKGALTENGAISFSMFGPATFWELGHSLKAVLGSRIEIDAAGFLKKDAIELIMNRHFKDVAVREEVVKEKFSSLAQLLNKIRSTGAWGDAMKNILLWRRDAFNKVEEAYKLNFGGIETSYQIFFCRGIR